MTCIRCKLLESRIRELETELAFRDRDTSYERVIAATTLTAAETAILMELYRARTGVVPSAYLLDALPRGGGMKSLQVQVMRVRKKLGGDVISTRYGTGYALTRKGLEMIDQILQTQDSNRGTPS